jgi:hypothetical protein
VNQMSTCDSYPTSMLEEVLGGNDITQ